MGPFSLCAPDLLSTPTILDRRPYYLMSPSRVLFCVRPPRSTPFCLSFSTLTFWFDLWSLLAVSVVQPLPVSPLSPRRYSCLSIIRVDVRSFQFCSSFIVLYLVFAWS